MLLRERNSLKAWRDIPMRQRPKPTTRIYWFTDREAYRVLAITLGRAAPAEDPRKFQDLLRPELKGKLALTMKARPAALSAA
jgi:hypothetical protein